MATAPRPEPTSIPSVDRLLNQASLQALVSAQGHAVVRDAARAELAALRRALTDDTTGEPPSLEPERIAGRVAERVAAEIRPSLRPVLNLTGTVLHTNLGRAPLPEVAIEAVAAAARGNVNLEFDLDSGRRGDRDSHLEAWLCRLTGAEAATVVNNNAAAVLLVLNTLARRRGVAVSRGELIEIGGAFRIPDIMTRAGARLVEVGTTNRTHPKDYETALEQGLALMMKVHTSNYVIQGFTASVPEVELAALAARHGVPFAVDLGSGTLVDLARFGLPHEPTVAETVAAGADLVTFSGDKLLGGPQAGIIVGNKDLVAKLKRNPMKRAMRLDKMTIAALTAILPLYANPGRLVAAVPTLRLMTRGVGDIRAAATRLLSPVAERLAGHATVEIVDCEAEIGSGALPTKTLASVALALRPQVAKRGRGKALGRLAAAFRALPVPVIGRLGDDALLLDLRCLEDEAAFLGQLGELRLDGP
ncbi:MAG: L-seryl-tRNA(Sec) selenium transferase [Alphaproteobacteria bacterium]|jgi:L-seryl-tRNA(Ser) seleniumtransferase|nr:L-seryl-tRNA(Sec) selenium transferase [Alphaproteobacteria bacterium]